MTGYSDALRGYAYSVHERDGFRCVYCGLDGTVWPNWLYLSWDHLLPKGHPDRDDERYIVTACRICNEFHNRTLFDVMDKTWRRNQCRWIAAFAGACRSFRGSMPSR